VESPSLEIFQPRLDAVLCSLLWVTLLRQGVGLDDPQGSLPTPTILWFCGGASWSRQRRGCTAHGSWGREQHLSPGCIYERVLVITSVGAMHSFSQQHSSFSLTFFVPLPTLLSAGIILEAPTRQHGWDSRHHL